MHPIVARMLFSGTRIFVRVFRQAYLQALVNAAASGVADEAGQKAVHEESKTLTQHEARLILGVSYTADWDEIEHKYDVLFRRNAKEGSCYLQSKVHNAKQCLEDFYQNKGEEEEETL
ncbi:mitochondrial import inner membrane translocase subunit PAM16 like 2-like [Silene latifolia]|uniref:mitochondrial import inner membrane translocase subunit PAM16 like 2-like n=1 Tax=Silene latifolia TaxID=37657 RepID=UPI003D78AEE2